MKQKKKKKKKKEKKRKKEIRDHFTTYQKQAKWALSKKHYGTKKKREKNQIREWKRLSY